MLIDLTILSYHRFFDEPNDYRFSRTYEQFSHDIAKKVYDWICIDDARTCTIRACLMLNSENVRAKLFVCTSLVGTKGYCTWEEIKELSKFHDIENHSHVHKPHPEVRYERQAESIKTAQDIITEKIGRPPRYFVAPFNQYNNDTEMAALSLGLVSVKDRINVLNISK